MRVLTDSELVRAAPQGRRCSSSRSTTRSTAASATRPASARCRTTTTSTTAQPSISRDAKVHATKFHDLSERIVLDNERCILCSRCVRFTREISKSNALGIKHRGDHSLVRAVGGRRLRPRPVLRQRRRHLPGRRAAVAAVPAQGARLVPASPRRRCARAARAAARSTSGTASTEWQLDALDPQQNAAHRRASRRSRTRRSTGRGSATRAATSRRSSSVRAPRRRC